MHVLALCGVPVTVDGGSVSMDSSGLITGCLVQQILPYRLVVFSYLLLSGWLIPEAYVLRVIRVIHWNMQGTRNPTGAKERLSAR